MKSEMLYPNIEKLTFYGTEMMVHSSGICILQFQTLFFKKKYSFFFALFLWRAIRILDFKPCFQKKKNRSFFSLLVKS